MNAAKIRSVNELADDYDVHRSTIRRWLLRERTTAVHGNRPSHPEIATLEQMRDDGLTLAQIGEHYGVSRQRVHQWMAS